MKRCLAWFSLILGLSLALAGQILASEDLILYLPFDQQNGRKAIDKSQYGNDGTIENGKWVARKFGQGLESNGETSRLKIARSRRDQVHGQMGHVGGKC